MLLAVGFFFEVIQSNENSKIENQKSHGSIWQEINVNCDLALLMAFLWFKKAVRNFIIFDFLRLSGISMKTESSHEKETFQTSKKVWLFFYASFLLWQNCNLLEVSNGVGLSRLTVKSLAIRRLTVDFIPLLST